MTYHVLILPDWKGWSCDFTSNYIIKHLPHITFEKRYVKTMLDKPIITKDDDFDAVWMMLHHWHELLVSQVQSAGKLGETKILVGLRGAHGISKVESLDLSYVDAVCVQSFWAYCEVKQRIPEYPNIWIVYDGVDEEIFHPMLELRPQPHDFIIGWAGQSRLKVKRFPEIQKICSRFKHKFADCNPIFGKFAVPHDKMPEWYNGLSTFFHYSLREGAPRPVIEAASCGIPVVTSPTGFGQEVIHEDWHVRDREDAIYKLIQLSRNPELREEVGNRNRQEVLKRWTWKERAKRYDEFFRLKGRPYQEI